MNKHHQKRFGTIAIDKGFINENQLTRVLELQANENIREGKHRLLGEICIDEGLLTETQVDEILETMSQRIVYMIAVGR